MRPISRSIYESQDHVFLPFIREIHAFSDAQMRDSLGFYDAKAIFNLDEY